MRNSDYWKQRFTQLEEAQHNRSEQLADDIKRIFEETQKSLEKQIELWLRRLADNNGVSMSEARKMLDKNELKEFRWDVYEYIRHGKENALNQQWIKQLENASAKVHISRLEALKINTRQQLEVLFSKYSETVQTAMKETYVDEQFHTAYEIQKGIGIGFNVSMPDEKLLDKVIAKPWASDGFNFSERIWNNKNKLISEVHSQLTQNILTGRDPQHAIDAIAKKMNTSKYNAGRLVMTESAYFSSLARGDCYEYLEVEEYQIVATLDIKTSEICQNLDGKILPMKDYQSGVTAPPFHVYCRSTTVPHFKSNYGSVGQRAARDPETGKTYYVPADMTYPEWYEKFVGGGDKSHLQETSKYGMKIWKRVDKSGESGIIELRSDTSMNVLTRKRKPDTYIEPMPKKQFRAIKKAFQQQGGVIQQNNEIDAYLEKKHAEGITYNAETILLKQNPSRASVFEELIHTAQYRNGKNDGSAKSCLINEIEAQKKLIKYAKAYKLTEPEIRQTENALRKYQEDLETYIKLNGGG